jgi:release factor glutamine methyltransferase
MTLAERLQQAEAQLRTGPHPERARRDAETLLLHHLGKSRAWLLAHPSDQFGGCAAIGYAALIERRRSGEPIQYITGETEFYGLPFRVTPDVLIPRPETEHLVERALSIAQAWTSVLKGHDFSCAQTPGALAPEGNSESASSDTTLGASSFPRPAREGWENASPRILDIGTGSGAIAVAIAHCLSRASITATDISVTALSIARQNADRNGFAHRIRFLEGDLLDPVAGEQFDLIVSNPPYVGAADLDTLAVEVRDHEPALALFAGDDGLDIYRRLIPAAFESLGPGGFLLLEVGFGQQPAIRNFLADTGFQNIEFLPDLQAIPRVAVAQRP